MKTITSLLLLLACANASVAQGVFNNQTNNTLIKVVNDYPSQFKNIRGELMESRAGREAYKSIVAVPGALSTTITQMGAAHKQAVSWQSVLYAGNTFDAASKRFEELFNQIKNTIIKPEGEKAAIVNGLFIKPSATLDFTTIQFDLLPAIGVMQKLNIDLTMKNTGSQWTIILAVYDKDIKEQELLTAN